jgi:endonuclease III
MNPLIPTILDHLFPDPAIPLHHTNPFSFLVAVMLSAQCTDKKVNEVTPLLFAHGDHPQTILDMGYSRIEEILKPLGLYKTKASNIYKLCHILIDQYEGKIPETLEELKKLPGVGHKTASCVVSQIFKIPAFPVDTHIHRLAEKWGLSCGTSVEKTEKDLKNLFFKQNWNKRHLQIIYYARSYCPARGHDLEKCPICKALSLD